MDRLSLNGSWSLTQIGDSEQIPAHVPGCVHLDLLAAHKIEDPYFRDNELAVMWIGEKDWLYQRSFTLPDDLLARDRVLLRCEGLDTLATITLNGTEIGRADNMFRTWEFDVKPYLVPGENHIQVRFDSAVLYAQAKQAERNLPAWGDDYKVPGGQWLRKEQCNFGWDWGPRLVTCGIWRDIGLIAFDTARLTDVVITQDHSQPGAVGLHIAATAQTTRSAALTARFVVTFNDQIVTQAETPLADGSASVDLAVSDPQLWWPNGMGEQPFYTVTAELLDHTGQCLDSQARRIGLRTLRLDRHTDEWGESFQFEVNGVPFFAKGANWIPADTFAPRLTRADYVRLLESAAEVHINMLRIWGGGIYESDLFYDLCDELGLCVWQDFMFACATYPTFDEAYMANVQAEAEDNVRRLRHHPCLAMWCGNNELEQGLVCPEWTDRTMSWDDYGKLFDTLLPDVVQRLDPQRDYWPCSPHSPHG
ncbi:MAG: glycoside hydrolase family 2 protein, partial [Anaerolineae bacterium]|nr:glycoside hydrolase family 2 protein [Anaerolineae bacterium]